METILRLLAENPESLGEVVKTYIYLQFGMVINLVVCGLQFAKHKKPVRRLFTVQKRF